MGSNIFPAYKENVFPRRDLMHKLIDAYFIHVNTYLALLHRPTFERDVKIGLHLRDRGFGAVLLLVCAIGSALASDSAHSRHSHQPPPGFHWFDLVSTTELSLLARPRLFDLQTCAVRSFGDFGARRVHSSLSVWAAHCDVRERVGLSSG